MEVIYTQRYASREIVKQNIFEYIEAYYNWMHWDSAIGLMAPVAFENQYKMFVA